MEIKKINLKKSTLQFDVTIPKDRIQQEYDKTFKKLAEKLTVEGFRQGKAPLEIAKKNISSESVYREMINELMPEIYEELLKEEKLKPIVAPKVELIKAGQNEDWEVQFIVAEKPTVHLKKYKEAIAKLKDEKKKEEIWTPGKDKPEAKEPDEETKKRNHLNKALETVLKEVEVAVPDLLIEQEVNKRLTQLMDDVQKLGLTVETYLKSRNETIEDMKARLQKEIEETYKLEFALEEIAESEKIIVEEKDIVPFFENIKDLKAKEEAQKNAYFYISLLRRQKTLDYLASL